MFGSARITITDTCLYLRFENVGRRGKFNIVLSRFNESFPLKDWDEMSRSWVLPPGDLLKVIEFCKLTFGVKGFVSERKISHPHSPVNSF